MPDLHAQKETDIKASPEVVFDILSDITKHNELAGSGEVLTIRKLSDGQVGLGTVFEADESINIAGQTMEIVATSVVVVYDPPNSISWIPAPPFPTRRIQWWFHLTPQDGGTHVVQEVEVDLGDPTDPELIALKENYDDIRAPDVVGGMVKTLENLRLMAESRVSVS